jgi:hypothetical protein
MRTPRTSLSTHPRCLFCNPYNLEDDSWPTSYSTLFRDVSYASYSASSSHSSPWRIKGYHLATLRARTCPSREGRSKSLRLRPLSHRLVLMPHLPVPSKMSTTEALANCLGHVAANAGLPLNLGAQLKMCHLCKVAQHVVQNTATHLLTISGQYPFSRATLASSISLMAPQLGKSVRSTPVPEGYLCRIGIPNVAIPLDWAGHILGRGTPPCTRRRGGKIPAPPLASATYAALPQGLFQHSRKNALRSPGELYIQQSRMNIYIYIVRGPGGGRAGRRTAADNGDCSILINHGLWTVSEGWSGKMSGVPLAPAVTERQNMKSWARESPEKSL